MSLKNVTSPEKNISVLELHIDKAAFDDAVTKAYKKNVGKMNVPGFRKGKAPKSISWRSSRARRSTSFRSTKTAWS